MLILLFLMLSLMREVKGVEATLAKDINLLSIQTIHIHASRSIYPSCADMLSGFKITTITPLEK